MLELWVSLPWWLRIGAGVLSILVGALILFLGLTGRLMEGRRVVWWGAFAFIGAGFAMVMIGGKTDSEKNGYHF